MKPVIAKLKKTEPSIGEVITQIILADAIDIAFKKLHYTKEDEPEKIYRYLNPVQLRQLRRKKYENAEKLDSIIDVLSNSIPSIEWNVVKPLVLKIKSVVIKDVNTERVLWSKKLGFLSLFLQRIKKHARGILTPSGYNAIKVYLETERTSIDALTLMLKFKKLAINDIYFSYLCKVMLKSIRIRDPKTWDTIMKQGSISQETADEVNKITEKVKAKPKEKELVEKTLKDGRVVVRERVKKIVKSPITTPERYTRTKPFQELEQPLQYPHGDKNIEYNEEWTPTNNRVWYAKWPDPQTGNMKQIYTKEGRDDSNKEKWIRVDKFDKIFDSYKKEVRKDLNDASYKKRVVALMLFLISEAGMRIGNDTSEKDDVRGLHVLQKRHIESIEGNVLTLKYVDKDMVAQKYTLKLIPEAIKILKQIIKNKQSDDYIFTFQTKEGKVNQITHTMLNYALKNYYGLASKVDKKIRVHEHRHVLVNRWFKQFTNPKFMKDNNLSITPNDSDERKKEVRDIILTMVAKKIGHKDGNWKTTKKSYLDPALLQAFDDAYDIDASKKGSKGKDKSKKKLKLSTHSMYVASLKVLAKYEAQAAKKLKISQIKKSKVEDTRLDAKKRKNIMDDLMKDIKQEQKKRLKQGKLRDIKIEVPKKKKKTRDEIFKEKGYRIVKKEEIPISKKANDPKLQEFQERLKKAKKLEKEAGDILKGIPGLGEQPVNVTKDEVKKELSVTEKAIQDLQKEIRELKQKARDEYNRVVFKGGKKKDKRWDEPLAQWGRYQSIIKKKEDELSRKLNIEQKRIAKKQVEELVKKSRTLKKLKEVKESKTIKDRQSDQSKRLKELSEEDKVKKEMRDNLKNALSLIYKNRFNVRKQLKKKRLKANEQIIEKLKKVNSCLRKENTNIPELLKDNIDFLTTKISKEGKKDKVAFSFTDYTEGKNKKDLISLVQKGKLKYKCEFIFKLDDKNHIHAKLQLSAKDPERGKEWVLGEHESLGVSEIRVGKSKTGFDEPSFTHKRFEYAIERLLELAMKRSGIDLSKEELSDEVKRILNPLRPYHETYIQDGKRIIDTNTIYVNYGMDKVKNLMKEYRWKFVNAPTVDMNAGYFYRGDSLFDIVEQNKGITQCIINIRPDRG